MPRIFISYRRADSQRTTSRIYDRLVSAFGKRAIFKDVDTIRPGGNFRGALYEAAAKCRVMLVVIGPKWVSITDSNGNRRLDDPGDFTRLEIEIGLQRDSVKVIPVLVENASMPSATELPDALRELANQQSFSIHDDQIFHYDMDTLIKYLRITVRPKWWFLPRLAGVVAVLLVILIAMYLRPWSNQQTPTQTATFTATNKPTYVDTQIAAIGNLPEPSATAQLTLVSANTPELSATPQPTQAFTFTSTYTRTSDIAETETIELARLTATALYQVLSASETPTVLPSSTLANTPTYTPTPTPIYTDTLTVTLTNTLTPIRTDVVAPPPPLVSLTDHPVSCPSSKSERSRLGPVPPSGSARITSLSRQSGAPANPCDLPSVLNGERIIVRGVTTDLNNFNLYLLIYPFVEHAYFLAYINCKQPMDVQDGSWSTEADLGANDMDYDLVLIAVPVSHDTDKWLQDWTDACKNNVFRPFVPDTLGTPPLGKTPMPASGIREIDAVTVRTHP